MLLQVKKIRNNCLDLAFRSTGKDRLKLAATFTKELKSSNIAISIAYNTPWTIDLLTELWTHFCAETQLIIVDNSSQKSKRKEIMEICSAKKVTYIPLPKNPELHPSRSHGLALNYFWHNVIRKTNAVSQIGFIDHDCYPIKQWELNRQLNTSTAHGRYQSGWVKKYDCFNLWAGYTLLNIIQLGKEMLTDADFKPDRIRGLDTGGSNWKTIYSKLSLQKTTFATIRTANADKYIQGEKSLSAKLNSEILDDSFFHLSAASYKLKYNDEAIKQFCYNLYVDKTNLIPSFKSNLLRRYI